ncbi:MAG: heme ABC exporter ATP-binding protein CcmA [Anaerolineales bacterium]|nr:heme ABC exporter ATP-binding protein CcmA [Anaerolineales bacterium]MCW5856497.1 heme ABC exporter ATP-binding protein CcmA [Anaerolineales bacterium]
MIRARGLVKRYGLRPVLRGVSLQVGRGELVALLGPNGAGKSTLLRMLAGLTRPSLGQVTLAGLTLPEDAQQARARMGFVGHQTFLYEDLSAEQNLAFFASLYGLPDAGPRSAELLERFGLWGRHREPVRAFSRGMQQRLTLARALLHRPQVILLDEPYTGLDRTASAVLDECLSEQLQQGAAILLATHDLEPAQKLAHRACLLAGGELAASWTRRQLASAGFPRQYDRALHEALDD